MSKFIEWISALAPFLAPYPGWVKAVCASWVCLGAVMIVALVLARPQRTEASAKPEAAEMREAWLVIEGMEFYSAKEGAQVQVTADVNGTKLIYPSKAGIEWLEVGPGMSAQSFRLPPINHRYAIRFEAQVRVPRPRKAAPITGMLKSVKEDIVERSAIPYKGQYVLHTFDPVHNSRAAQADAQLNYRLTFQP